MEYSERLTNVSVLGAAGKMGSGILLLTAMEMVDLALDPTNKGKTYVLHAVDVSDLALSGVLKFLRVQVLKAAEKKTVQLRQVYANRADLIENKEIIEQYVTDTLNLVRPTTNLAAAYDSHIVFEAIKEDVDLKIKVLSQINQNSKHTPWFFSNTSSIPIQEIDDKAQLGGRMIGFHFYNPPAIQKLVELISGTATKPELVDFANAYAKKLRKVVVPSNDFAGFIGNGHFMRDALHGISEVERLSKDLPFVEAVCLVNSVSQDLLVRPMGIFQLIDYVGLDVCQAILTVMNPYFDKENLHSNLLDKMISLDVKGGQFANGSQKDGFLKYEAGRPVAIFDPETKAYTPLKEFKSNCDSKLGAVPDSIVSWKKAITARNKAELLATWFKDLAASDTLGSNLAFAYGRRSMKIGQQLVDDGIALNADDVNTVLLTGFYHSFGPINQYFK